MFSLNRAQIIGNLTRDPEMRYTPNGQAVVSFGVATNRRWRDKDGNNQEAAEFHDVVAWGKLAETMNQILHRGDKVYIEGRLQTRSWDAQDGSKRQRTEIVTEDWVALSPKGAAAHAASPSIPDAEEFPIQSDTKAAEGKPAKSNKKDSSEDQSKDDEINLDDIPF